MKKHQFIFLLAFLLFAIGNVYSQNYKQPIPSIDAQGKVTDAKGKHIGWVTSDGTIKDAAGVKIAHIDDQGNAVDAATGKALGKAAKNGTYLYHVQSGESDSLTVSVPMNGICEVKDKNGKTVLLVHEKLQAIWSLRYALSSDEKRAQGYENEVTMMLSLLCKSGG